MGTVIATETQPARPRARLPDRDTAWGPAVNAGLGRALDLARRYAGDGTMPSLALGVADAGSLLATHALGRAGSGAGIGSIFFLASLTKAIVATAVMQYVDEGRWDLHAPLHSYLPGFRGAGREAITAWHVLTHTSGLPDMPLEQLRRERPSYQRLSDDYRSRAPRWAPGSRYEYNSCAWVLLADTMAVLSAMPFERALRQRLTGPLGMVDTSFDPRYARGRVQPVSGVAMRNRLVGELLLHFLARARLAGGGLFGTLTDVLRLGQALLPPAAGTRISSDGLVGDRSPPRVLSDTAIETMAAPQTEAIPRIGPDGEVSYVAQAVGWRNPGPGWPQRAGVITHGGISGSRLWIDRQAGLVFALLTNRWEAPDEPTIAILEAVYEGWPQPTI